jgi:hypothetical protein
MNAPLRPELLCSAWATASLPAPGGPVRSRGSRTAQEIFGHTQLTLERRRPFRDARFERRIGCLQRVGRAQPLVVQLRVADRARDLVRDDRDQAAIVLVKGSRLRTLDREHSNQFVANQQRNRDLALRVGQTRDRYGVANVRAAAGFHHLPPLCRRVRTLLSKISELQHPPFLRHDADRARADSHTAADGLILVAAAGNDPQRVAAGLDEQNERVMRLEQVVERLQRQFVDLLEIERRVDLSGDALQYVELGGLARQRRCRTLRVGCRNRLVVTSRASRATRVAGLPDHCGYDTLSTESTR